MVPKRAQQRTNARCRRSVVILLLVSLLAPLIFLTGRMGTFSPTIGHKELPDWSASLTRRAENSRKLSTFENLLPQEVLQAISSNLDASEEEPLNLKIVGQKDLPSSLVKEDIEDITGNFSGNYQPIETVEIEVQSGNKTAQEAQNVSEKLEVTTSGQAADRLQNGVTSDQGESNKLIAQVTETVKNDSGISYGFPGKMQNEEYRAGTTRRKGGKVARKSDSPDALIRILRDQLIMGKAYASIAQAQNSILLFQELKTRNREIQEMLAEAEVDTELPPNVRERIKSTHQLIDKAKDLHYDCAVMVKKLRAMLHATELESRLLKKQSVYLSQLAAKTVPKGLHCLSMRLTVEYFLLPAERRKFSSFKERLENPNLYHYALFSDNILAASVVVNSTISHAKEPEKHVFHLVTDKLNYGAMKMWFLANPPGNATIEVQNVDDFTWLNSSYCPVLRQLESASMKEYYFKSNSQANVASGSATLKYRNPKYLSMLNHLRFYLPQIYPKLDKIVFLDDDIVVQKDLTPLWNIDLRGNVNGAVETCGPSFHRFDKYLNFSNPLISSSFDPNACGWAYGMNVFDLEEWKKQDITGIYHKWQNMNEDRTLWNLGTLPPGLITFYNMTFALPKHWHVLGLGYNADVRRREIDRAAVIHYNGNMKPWLDIGMAKYKNYWTTYVKYDHPFLQQCNINE